jgi:choline-sulfatase
MTLLRHVRTRTWRAVLAVTAACAIALTPLGCSKGSAGKQDNRPNVLLIISDTTRVDRLGCYGNPAGTTPNIDKWAAEGVRFQHAYAQAPWTLPSTATLMTSLYPRVHGAGGRLNRFTALSESATTLAELFGDAGYQTAAIINVLFLSNKFGLTRGFEHVDYFDSTNAKMRPAKDTTDAALEWIKDQRGEPFFAFVHYFDPHLVYDPPDEFREKFAADLDQSARDNAFGTIAEMIKLRRGQLAVSRERVKRLEKLYDGEVAYVDQQVGRLLDELQSSGVLDNTIVVLTADHGEEFNDHDGFEHGHTVYEELVHVPLVFLGKSIPQGVTPPDVVGLIDVAPTLCDLARIDFPQSFAGRSLIPAIDGETMPPQALLYQWNMWGPPVEGLRKAQYKLIVHPQRAELYDIVADPQEKNDLVTAQPEVVKQMKDDLDALSQALKLEAAGSSRKDLTLSPEERARLCSLGYIDCSD